MLVTVGSGYIGLWCVVGLLQQGYAVRTTVRDLRREAEVRASIGKMVDPGNRRSVHAANLTDDAGWETAAEGAEYVLHAASPLGVPPPKDPNNLIIPARDGALRALRVGTKAGAERVVMSSSVAATSPDPRQPDGASDVTVWTGPNNPATDAHAKLKTIAEPAP